MIMSENGHIRNAAVALFTKEDYASLQLHIRLARFRGTNKYMPDSLLTIC